MPMKKLISLSLLALLSAAIFLLFILPFLPPTKEQREKALVDVEYQRYYVLTVDHEPYLYISGIDRNFNPNQVALSPDSLELETQKLHGCWVSRYLLLPYCRGQVMTSNPDTAIVSILKAMNNNIKATLDKNMEKLLADSAQLAKKMDELGYYLERHNVNDDGYNIVGSYAADVFDAINDVKQALFLLRTIDYKKRIEIELCRKYFLTIDGKRIPCEMVDMEVKNHRQLIIAENDTMPKGAYVLYNNIVNDEYIENVIRSKPQERLTWNYSGTTENGLYEGHGVLRDIKGNFYDGMWDDGKREGFGFAIDSTGHVRVGEWKDDKFRGERMTHNTERIYGIDIARYQHEQGRRHFKIEWSKLRITHLGTISKKRINGIVDYPVSFCYIKATEGTTVTNKYYKEDYQQARSHGIHCGSYHFFSLSSGAREQAEHFLKTAHINNIDFPPVLDIEPSDAQIRAYGGIDLLFKNVRTWLDIVEKRCGKRPILYVNQMFVNKYLVNATDIKKNYQVWIARYGEYRPDVRLLFWQLCPDGRVSGIVPQVDINVFNGDREQFEEFICSQAPYQ